MADFFLDVVNRGTNELVHRPPRQTSADLEHKVCQHLRSPLRVNNLRVELHAIDLFGAIGKRRDGRVERMGKFHKPLRQKFDLIAVAHPASHVGRHI